ncbi:MAG: TIGR00282 family metallophosphoesterase [Planctomycetota bacterium]
MLLLCIGDIVGRPGRKMVSEYVPRLKRAGVDFVVANGENAAGGSGITAEVLEEMLSSGVDVVTTGDHVFRNKAVFEVISSDKRLLRPANFSSRCPGTGRGMYEAKGLKIAVINLIGRVFMAPSECPFAAADDILEELSDMADAVIVDFHAEATSEKIAMGRYLDGRTAVVFGTHTHVQTADETILSGGTAYITDIGMTGPFDSVIGREVEPVLETFLTGMPAKFDVSKKDVRLSGILVRLDLHGRPTAISRLQIKEGTPMEEITLV